MNGKTKLVLVTLLLVVFVGALLAACDLVPDTATPTTDELYDNYAKTVEAAGYRPISKTEFQQVLAAATANGGTVTKVGTALVTNDGTSKWMLTISLSNGTIKTAELAANRADTPDPDPNPDPKPDPDPKPEPTGHDGTSIEKAYNIAEAIQQTKQLAQGAHSDRKVYVRGYITSEPKYFDSHKSYDFYLSDDVTDTTNPFMAYSAKLTVDGTIKQGDDVVIYGYLIHFVNKNNETVYEIGYASKLGNPQIVLVNNNGGTVTPDPDPQPEPTEHHFPNYFTYGTCTDDGCDVIGRKPADGKFQATFKYTLTEAEYNSYVELYDWMVANVNNSATDADEFYIKLIDLVDGLNHVYDQNDIASVLADVSGNTTDYDNSTEWYYDLLDKYFDVIVKANSSTNSAIKKALAINVDQEDIDYALSEGSGEATTIQSDIDKILAQYNNELNKNNPSASTIADLYEQLVNKNNQLAKLYGYDNYMSYAYENVYNRSYTPAQTKAMSALVKQYIVPLYNDITAKYKTADAAIENAADADKNLYNGLLFDSLFTDTDDQYFDEVKDVIDLISDYFKYLDGTDNVMFYDAVEDLFQTGNYFLGQNEGAYTYYMPQVGNTVLYFDNTDYGDATYYYSNAFTFVHEFGHYYENIHNNTTDGERTLSYDFCETQSQGDEMMFLLWLGGNTNATKGYNAVKYAQLSNMLQTVLNATAVDEFEQAVYSGSYEGFDTLNANNYQDLYDTICEKYGISSDYGNDYWMYVCFDNAAYYISYAMSALPSLEIYAKGAAQEASIDTARNAYLTLYTNKSTDYNTVLAAAGLHNAFEEALYTLLASSIK